MCVSGIGLDAFRGETMPLAEESPARSWWNVGSTLAILLALLVCAAVVPWWPLRLAASITSGLVMVRTFILYHDYMHGALLSESRLAQATFHTIGALMLAPPRHWRHSHNFPHSHVGKVVGRDKKRDRGNLLTCPVDTQSDARPTPPINQRLLCW